MKTTEINKFTGYELTDKWFEFSFAYPEKVIGNHGNLYHFICWRAYKLAWVAHFGLPRLDAMGAIGIKIIKLRLKYSMI